jgi:hypothetical protein
MKLIDYITYSFCILYQLFQYFIFVMEICEWITLFALKELM